ncbi:cell division cycle-associated 7-like protein isoform X2 [Syngnathoides biaculeatus]|uniref:cell division cycle-associated 7-like protein isoform X2 n=1 Tax=Syngnathoides biaculeatus TaxID=300417 RepID=UPI002ADD6842|nr:cell division cycle-associated 7-like protein isoform X2 [Syngnathoides biaculeatus]
MLIFKSISTRCCCETKTEVLRRALLLNGDKMARESKTLHFKSKFITAELARLFSQSDSEEDFEGFSDDDERGDRRRFKMQFNTKMLESKYGSDEDTSFYSDGEETPAPKRKSLLVALRFPVKQSPTPNREPQAKNLRKPVKETVAQRVRQRMKKQEEDEQRAEEAEEVRGEDDAMCQSLRKREKNIQENKAMLAQLFADLSTMADLTFPNTPQKKKRSPVKTTPRKRKLEQDRGSERRNPSRKARPPENFGVENVCEPLPLSGAKVDEENAANGTKKRRSHRRSQFEFKSVDDITEEDLDNVAFRSKDKIWDKDNGSSCHQCRQKTLDTKTVCRSGFCSAGKGQFCGPCLKNRYGEDVCTVLLDPTWSCPICRGMCNCSLCRKKEGRCATGILVGLARYNGHNNVHEYLERIQKELQ